MKNKNLLRNFLVGFAIGAVAVLVFNFLTQDPQESGEVVTAAETIDN
ncbi:MAG: hypothetical protein LBG64_04380 [Pseudomonadales bacterium]|jgi:hypothetical protein|nr:hypothetical protein [Pseudomonadales bacterium]